MFFNKSELKRLNHFAEKVPSVGKRLYLWEMNYEQREALIFFQQKGYTVDAFISFNVYPDLRKAWGINVYHPEFLNRPYKEDFILCISGYEYRLHKRYLLNGLRLSRRQIYVDYKIPSAVKERLIRIGIRFHDRILGVCNRIRAGYNRLVGQTKRMLWIVQSFNKYISGYRIYKKLRKKYEFEIPLLYFNYPGSGDAYLSGCVLQTYLQDHPMERYAIVATGRVSRIILESFGYRNIIAITDGESDILRRFVNIVGADKLHIKVMIQVANHLDISLKLAATRLSLLDMYVYKVFEYDRCPQLSFPGFSSDPKRIEALFRDLKLRKGHTVILSPYANSEVGFSPMFWTNIVSLLKEMGFDVATMCHAPEVPLKFTTPLDFPLPYTAFVLEYAGGFIGVRSGFCDVAIPAKCKKMILYPENIYGLSHPFYKTPLSHINSRPIYEWAAFREMGIDAGATEIRCNYHYTKHLEQIIRKVLGEK